MSDTDRNRYDPFEEQRIRAKRDLLAELSRIERTEPEYLRSMAVARALVRYVDDEEVEQHIRRLRLVRALLDE